MENAAAKARAYDDIETAIRSVCALGVCDVTPRGKSGALGALNEARACLVASDEVLAAEREQEDFRQWKRDRALRAASR